MTIKHWMMNFIFLDMTVAGGLCGYVCHKYCVGNGWEIIFGIVLSITAIFVGMILAFMVADDRERGKRIKIEYEYRLQLRQLLHNERISCAKVAVNMSKAMTDRVANTIVAKYVDGISDDGKRRAVLDGVNKIIDSEAGSLSKALFDGLTELEEK